MRRMFIAVALLTAALALPAAAGAGAGAGSSITLRLGDGFAVKKSNILCAVQISHTLVPGQKLIACYFFGPKGPVAKTYTVGLAVNGKVGLGRVGKDGKLEVVTTRGGGGGSAPAPPLRERKGTLRQVGLGTAVLVKGTAITCAVSTQKFGGKPARTVGCFKVNQEKKPRPNSWGIGITDGGAFLVHFDKNSKGSPVKVVLHGK
jgi:hypothetical protein